MERWGLWGLMSDTLCRLFELPPGVVCGGSVGVLNVWGLSCEAVDGGWFWFSTSGG
jgi:hypothetical protein